MPFSSIPVEKDNSGGYGAYRPYFEYNAQDKLYYRYQDGKKQIDEYDGSQLAVSNVILQYCHGEVRDKKGLSRFLAFTAKAMPSFLPTAK